MSNPSRAPGLDFLRAIAILWVMLFHFRPLHLPAALYWPSRYGWMGVDLFFVLSGYLIGLQLLRPYLKSSVPSLREFYMRRAFRIIPAFLSVLALYLFLPAFREAPGLSPAWQFLTFTENFRIDYLHDQAFSHFWSLCVEEHFYLALPVLVLLLMRRPSFTKAAMAASGIMLFGIVVRWAIYSHQLAPLLASNDDNFTLAYIERIYYPTHTRLDGLLVGVVLASVSAFRPEWWAWLMQRGRLLALSGASLCGFVMWLFRDRFSFPGTVFGYPLMSAGLGLIVVACAGPGNRFLRLRGFAGLAALAYSMYLTHKEIAHLDQRFLGGYLRPDSWVAVVIYFGTCFLAAGALYFVVERPFLLLRERVAAGMRPVVVEAAANVS